DIDHIEPGDDFVQVIENAVGSCKILLAIIGRRWLLSADENSRRLDNPKDFVRLEIAAALNRNIRVIPILVQGASMPRPVDLPNELSKLSYRNALELSDLRWRHDVNKLIYVIEKILADGPEARATALPKAGDSKPRDAAPAKTSVVREPTPAATEIMTRPTAAQTSATSGPTQRKRALLVVVGILAVAVGIAAVAFKWSPPTPSTTNTPASTNGAQADKQVRNDPAPPAGMVYVPGGVFMMGRDNGDEYERPAHRVPVQPFFIDQYEVTSEEYAKFVQATGRQPPPGWTNGKFPADAARKPITGVTWNDAKAYCERNGKRLPSEAEWEFAARGTDGRLYPWGNEWQWGMANAGRVEADLADVGTHKGASPFGVFDLVGNAWEWTADDMTAYPGGKLPEQPPKGTKVLRGGTYLSDSSQATATYRLGYKASGESDYTETGFRCAKSAQ
ncbi:MAG: SUMF1/EgtB/PvdO family nonheme iron enzyme, partial [Acidobacteriota bacterium]|nr:SUMF1/EgtB/PvdO family nonheme iron enzyme [Acidobacteriota bacterium]